MSKARQILEDPEVQESLVKAAQQAVRDTRPEKLELSQITNVLAVAAKTSSVLVVTNFIRYQMGRNRDWQGLGKRITEDLETGQVHQLANKWPEQERQKTHIELARRYLGFLRRYFYYCKKVEWGKGEGRG